MSSTDKAIGLLTWDYGKPKGGMGRSLQHIVEVLRSVHVGAPPSVLAGPPSSEAWRPALESNGSAPVKTVSILAPCPGESGDDPLLRFTARFGGQILFSLLLPFVLERRLRGLDRLLLPVGPGGVLLLSKPSVESVAIVYHSYAQQSALVPGQRWKKMFCPFERRTLSFCSKIICVCDDTKQALMRAYEIDPSNIIVVPHAVAPSAVQAMRDPLLCVCVARLEARKGVDVLLRAWPQIHHMVPDARLVIVGDGVQREKIDRMIGKLTGVERRSSLPQKELDLLLAQASVAFCPAYLEGFGLACAEAMLAGCCVIASNTDGLRSLIDDECGILVPPGDHAAFADAAIRALRNADLRTSISHAAVKRIKILCDPATADAAFIAAL